VSEDPSQTMGVVADNVVESMYGGCLLATWWSSYLASFGPRSPAIDALVALGLPGLFELFSLLPFGLGRNLHLALSLSLVGILCLEPLFLLVDLDEQLRDANQQHRHTELGLGLGNALRAAFTSCSLLQRSNVLVVLFLRRGEHSLAHGSHVVVDQHLVRLVQVVERHRSAVVVQILVWMNLDA
jgi:hypothetical protein